MKKREEILKSMEEEMPYPLPKLIKPYIREAMEAYATEAIKADRERVAEKAKIAFHCGTTKVTHSISHYQSGADNIQIDKESILNLPIELKWWKLYYTSRD